MLSAAGSVALQHLLHYIYSVLHMTLWLRTDCACIAGLLSLETDERVNQNEVLTIHSVSNGGLTVTTVEALKFNHYG
jgi:hypothetical protein